MPRVIVTGNDVDEQSCEPHQLERKIRRRKGVPQPKSRRRKSGRNLLPPDRLQTNVSHDRASQNATCDEGPDLIQVVQDVSWRGVRIEGQKGNKKGKAAAYPVQYGMHIDIGPRESLLWTHGDVNGIADRGSFLFRADAVRRGQSD